VEGGTEEPGEPAVLPQVTPTASVEELTLPTLRTTFDWGLTHPEYPEEEEEETNTHLE
jgi:hypothetical protein